MSADDQPETMDGRLRIFTDHREDGDHLREIGSAWADAINAVAVGLGAPGDVVQFNGVIRVIRRACDGCAAVASDMARPEGWTEAPGRFDYCPHCSECPILRAPAGDRVEPVASDDESGRKPLNQNLGATE